MGKSAEARGNSPDIIAREAEITALCRRYVEAGRPENMGRELADLVIRHTIEADYESLGCHFFSFACVQLGDKISDLALFVNIFMEKAKAASAGSDVNCACMNFAGEVKKTTGDV